MTDYIARAGVLAEYDRLHSGPAGAAREIIERYPAADVVDVVRCRECKYNGLLECPLVMIEKKQMVFINRSDDWFCADGERKDGGHDDA